MKNKFHTRKNYEVVYNTLLRETKHSGSAWGKSDEMSDVQLKLEINALLLSADCLTMDIDELNMELI